MKKIKYILTALALLIAISIFAAIYISVIDGDWSTNSTWGDVSSPAISTSDDITINNSVSTASNIIIKAGGYLTIKSGAILTVNDMQFNNGSYIVIEEGGQLIVNGNLVNKNNSIDVEVNGSIDVLGSFDNGSGGNIFGTGDIHAAGSFTGNGVTFGQTNNTIPAGSTISGTPMPVELLSFTYEYSENTIQLEWITASETNNDYFTIGRSDDNINFIEINKTSGVGNSNSTQYYEFTDTEPLKGVSYYRLKQTDYDGNFEYVGTLACNLADNNVISNISVYDFNGQLVYKTQNIASLKGKIKSGIYIVVDQNLKSHKIFIN